MPSCERRLIELVWLQTGGQTGGAACRGAALSERQQLASEIQFSTEFLLLDQEMGGWKVQCLQSSSSNQFQWPPSDRVRPQNHFTSAAEMKTPRHFVFVCTFLLLMECIFLRYENRTHIEIRNWTAASKGHSYYCGRYDGNRKACPRSITPVTLGKGQSRSILACVGPMTAAQRHVLVFVMRWHQPAGSTSRKTGNSVGHGEIEWQLPCHTRGWLLVCDPCFCSVSHLNNKKNKHGDLMWKKMLVGDKVLGIVQLKLARACDSKQTKNRIDHLC